MTCSGNSNAATVRPGKPAAAHVIRHPKVLDKLAFLAGLRAFLKACPEASSYRGSDQPPTA